MRHLQFPWAVAHEARDSGFKVFARTPRMFIDTWFAQDDDGRVGFLDVARGIGGGLTACGIMGRVLSVDPAARADVSDIVRDPWFRTLL
ncbi:hypothetical protein IWW50_005692 [Coemansia erecta]|nr:hypothetical protein IWW50_005692 [Coemansia erecta]